ncbi:MAG TPA: S-adenosyl-L-homocysteine hydrolase [Novosphingobium sp.]|nr:S-adenosyl-L-homocysteine hydrolase [Novosphingobium sp.]HQA19134.1 S-adenosyl-L-homocysteine hydrolase [Novosphingobium sp.]
MKIYKGVAAGLAAAMVLVSVPATAAGGMGQAEKLRRLDIMLMVTGLRCRSTADNFNSEYGRFTTAHLQTLNAASNELKADYARRYGAAGANRALDKLSVQMANQYGQGHPWLSCHQLKQVAGSLAQMRGVQPLVAAADELLDTSGPRQLAWLAK